MATLVVSNRLPISVARTQDGIRVSRSSGGLATALASSESLPESKWIGWVGLSDMTTAEQDSVRQRGAQLNLFPVDLTAGEEEGYYEHFANGVVWPLFHYMPGQLPLQVKGWGDYYNVNRKFADVVQAHYQPGDKIWVHDYHLMLLPRLLRDRLPEACIGFFLHIPFPVSEIFALLPHREEILHGLLGSDLLGFHTLRYTQHFATTLKRLCGIDVHDSTITEGRRTIRLGVYPIGVNARSFDERARAKPVQDEVAKLTQHDATRLILGVDRLDYTKGIPRRLLAFAHLLEQKAEWRGKVRLVQVAVPSRDAVGAYRRFRQEVNTLVGSINGRFATPHWTPVQYLHRSIADMQLLALYRAADVMLVTPIRDGMNLVAKEFIATRSDEEGVLILSEFAGAADELSDAIIVNPFDVEATARQIDVALRISKEERRTRMRKLRRVVFDHDVDTWIRNFMRDLCAPA